MTVKHTFYYIRRLAFLTLAFVFSGSLFLYVGQVQPDIVNSYHLSWLYETEFGANIQPTSDGEVVYVPLKEGNLISLRLIDGAFLWRGENGGKISAAPVADVNRVYLSTQISNIKPQDSPGQTIGILRALSRSNGVTLWEKAIPAALSKLISNETTLFGIASNGKLYAFAKVDGEVLWVKSTSIPFIPSPILRAGRIYISDEQGNILSIDQITGRTLRLYQTQANSSQSLSVFDRSIFLGSNDGNVYAIDEATGRLKWRAHINGAIQALQVAGKCILVTSLDNFVYCLSPKRGIKIWKRRLTGRILDQPLVFKGNLVISTITSEESVILSLQNGNVINSIFLGEGNYTVTAPIFSGDFILFTTQKGLIAISTR